MITKSTSGLHTHTHTHRDKDIHTHMCVSSLPIHIHAEKSTSFNLKIQNSLAPSHHHTGPWRPATPTQAPTYLLSLNACLLSVIQACFAFKISSLQTERVLQNETAQSNSSSSDPRVGAGYPSHRLGSECTSLDSDLDVCYNLILIRGVMV